MGDEPLRSAGIFTGQRHPDRAAFVARLIYLATNLIAGPAVTIAARITVLNNKIWNHAMNCDAIKVTALSELDEIVDSHWRFFRQQLNRKGTFGGCYDGAESFVDTGECPLVVCSSIASSYDADTRGKITSAIGFQNGYGFSADQMVV